MHAYVLYTFLMFLIAALMVVATMFDPDLNTYKSPKAWVLLIVLSNFALWGMIVL